MKTAIGILVGAILATGAVTVMLVLWYGAAEIFRDKQGKT